MRKIIITVLALLISAVSITQVEAQEIRRTEYEMFSPSSVPVDLPDIHESSWDADTTGSGCFIERNSDTSVWCYGRNNYGQFGDGFATSYNYYPPKEIESAQGADNVYSNGKTNCITKSGELLCWGRFYIWFQSGLLPSPVNPTLFNMFITTKPQIQTVDTSREGGVTEVTMGSQSVCWIGAADEEVYCLGDALDPGSQLQPTLQGWKIEGLQGAEKIAIRAGNAFGICATIGTEVKCAGENPIQNVTTTKNNDTRTLTSTPIAIRDIGLEMINISVSYKQLCIVTSTYEPQCLGLSMPRMKKYSSSYWRSLNDSTATTEFAPLTDILSNAGVSFNPNDFDKAIDIELSGYSGCLINNNQDLACWGTPFSHGLAQYSQFRGILNASTNVVEIGDAVKLVSYRCLQTQQRKSLCWHSSDDPAESPLIAATGKEFAPLPQLDLSDVDGQTYGHCPELNEDGIIMRDSLTGKTIDTNTLRILEGDVNCDGEVHIAILGDSYISGEGTVLHDARFTGPEGHESNGPPENYLIKYDGNGGTTWDSTDNQTDKEGNICHRSKHSWAWRAAEQYANQGDIHFIACSGAVASNLAHQAQRPENNDVEVLFESTEVQLQDLRNVEESSSVDIVYLSIGGNDFGFSTLVEGCIKSLFTDCLDEMSNVDEWKKSVDYAALNARWAIEATKEVSPNASVFVMGYPDPVTNPDTCDASSLLPTLWGVQAMVGGISTNAQMQMHEELMPYMSLQLSKAAIESGANYIDSTGYFDHHSICDDTPYTNGLIDRFNSVVNHDATIKVWDVETDTLLILPPRKFNQSPGVDMDSFHPTRLGHAALLQAYHDNAQDIYNNPLSNETDLVEGDSELIIDNATILVDTTFNLYLDRKQRATLHLVETGKISVYIGENPIFVGEYDPSIDLATLREAAEALAPTGVSMMEIYRSDTGEHYLSESVIVPPENCVWDEPDTDGDGIPDNCDSDNTDGPQSDIDGDGIPREIDPCPFSPIAKPCEDIDGYSIHRIAIRGNWTENEIITIEGFVAIPIAGIEYDLSNKNKDATLYATALFKDMNNISTPNPIDVDRYRRILLDSGYLSAAEAFLDEYGYSDLTDSELLSHIVSKYVTYNTGESWETTTEDMSFPEILNYFINFKHTNPINTVEEASPTHIQTFSIYDDSRRDLRRVAEAYQFSVDGGYSDSYGYSKIRFIETFGETYPFNIFRAFQLSLGREPTYEEISFWADQLEAGMERHMVIYSLINSQEGKYYHDTH